MKIKLMIVAVCAAAALPGSGIAHADPAAPDPNGPKCWVQEGDNPWQLAPCGWAYSKEQGWHRVPTPPPPMGPAEPDSEQ